MPLYFAALNSGSNGNCYYVGNDNEAVLVDVGISCREADKRMSRLGLSMEKVKAIFVSHEHTDHISGVKMLSKKYQLPVYITSQTLRSAGILTEKHLVKSFTAGEPVRIGGLSITSFIKSHDASDPHSFLISGNRVNVGVFTDIGHCCKELIHHFKQCHAAFLESNYCEDMLMNGSYPYVLKKRISSDKGHLSNAQALELFTKHRGPQLQHLVLSHLSKENNDPQLVAKLFGEKAGTVHVTVASRYEETAVLQVDTNGHPLQMMYKKRTMKPGQQQLSLFN
jgi:phosphoribosyl 1,2-cyclic phosphodiesterase